MSQHQGAPPPETPEHSRHRRLRIGLSGAIAAALMLLIVTPANAAAFRYWGYYQWQDDAWTFAQTGPDQSTPADGSVEGWRFAVTDEQSVREPRAAGDFDAICGDTEAGSGEKRVAVVIDYGTPEDTADGAQPPAARGECAVVPTDATGSVVLSTVAEVRIENALVCGLDGWPATGCGDQIEGAAPTGEEELVTLQLPGSGDNDTATDSDDGMSAGTWALMGVGAVAVVGLGFGAMRLNRRNAGT